MCTHLGGSLGGGGLDGEGLADHRGAESHSRGHVRGVVEVGLRENF